MTIGVGMAALTVLGAVVTLGLRRRAPLALRPESVRPAGDREQVLAERRIGHEPLHGSAERDDDLVVAA